MLDYHAGVFIARGRRVPFVVDYLSLEFTDVTIAGVGDFSISRDHVVFHPDLGGRPAIRRERHAFLRAAVRTWTRYMGLSVRTID